MNTSVSIQVVDDDDAVRTSLVFCLQIIGFEVTDYLSASEFLERGQTEHGILICDVQMPGMNGIELAHLLRKRESTIAIILASGSAEPTLTSETLSANVAAVLEKPIELTHLLARIGSITAEWPN
ncbi:MAG: response regulator [Tardiphaga sp.]|nr:response regulator [Tardiphaga sp.]